MCGVGSYEKNEKGKFDMLDEIYFYVPLARWNENIDMAGEIMQYGDNQIWDSSRRRSGNLQSFCGYSAGNPPLYFHYDPAVNTAVVQ